MGSAYNEEELLLRLLVGVVFPILILVMLRMARFGLRSFEKRWRSPAADWLGGLLSRGGLRNPAAKSRRAVALLLGLERTIVFSLAVILLSVAWFILFPQTRALAQELVRAIVTPILDLAGTILRGLLLILYSLALFGGAFLADRFLSRRVAQRHRDSILALSLFSLPLRMAVWLLAVFLFLLPYPGLPRIFAVGLLLLVLLLALLALRPLIEEMAVGANLHSTLGLAKGVEIKVEGQSYRIFDLKPLHAVLEKDGELQYMPYSRILGSVVSKAGESPHVES
jgi:hypothetical protein